MRTRPVTGYYFGDVQTQKSALHDHADTIGRVNLVRQQNDVPLIPFDLGRAVRLMTARVSQFYDGTSRYFPHQGKKECIRRCVQRDKFYYDRDTDTLHLLRMTRLQLAALDHEGGQP